MVNHSSSCQAADLALAIGPLQATFNISVEVDSSSKQCSVNDYSGGFRCAHACLFCLYGVGNLKQSVSTDTGGACFVATSRYRQPGTGYEIVGRIDDSRFTTMEHGAGGGAPCL